MLEVKRNARVGEWIKPTNDWLAVKKNSIYQVKKDYGNGAIGVDTGYRIGIDGLHALSPNEYVVLENYQPEVRVLADYKEMNERILNLLALCMKAKEKGHDCFFNYYPHVSSGQFNVAVYLNGWDKDVVPDRCLYLCADGKKSYGTDSIDEVEEYLKGLM